MLTITISARTLALGVILALFSALGLYATDALAGDPQEPRIQGDVNCSEGVGTDDILDSLLHVAELDDAPQTEPCTDIGDVIPAGEGQQGPPGPEGPQGIQGLPGQQGPPGINLFANVTAGGVVENGNATDATRESAGRYVVSFNTDISSCTAVVTPGTVNGGSTQPGIPSIQFGSLDLGPNQIHVSFQKPNLDAVDTDFHLIVVC